MRTRLFLKPAAILLSSALSGQGQQPPRPQPITPKSPPANITDQDPIRISTEEVQLSVAAFDSFGRLDPSVQRDDILILEDGVPQEIRSARRIPANVILLLDTGGELNSAKRVAVTREIAKQLLNSLAVDDQISVMQFNSKVELLADWTTNPRTVLPILESKLLPGKRARFLTALAEVAVRFTNSGRLNRHLVLVTDGVQSPGDRVDRSTVMQQLAAANLTVHVISYTTLSRKATQKDLRRTRKRDKSIVSDDAVNSTPDDLRYNTLKQAHQPGGIVLDLDLDRRRQVKAYELALQISQGQLERLAEDTGGRIWLPESVAGMVDGATDAARLIDAAYLVTYKPKRALADAPAGEVRRIEVVSRRVGLHLKTRQRYIVPDPSSENARPRRIGN